MLHVPQHHALPGMAGSASAGAAAGGAQALATAWTSISCALSSPEATQPLPPPVPQHIATLCAAGQASQLLSFACQSLECSLRATHVPGFWRAVTVSTAAAEGGCCVNELESPLLLGLQQLCGAVDDRQRLLAALQQEVIRNLADDTPAAVRGRVQPQHRQPSPHLSPQLVAQLAGLPGVPRQCASASLLADAPCSLPHLLRRYYAGKLAELSAAAAEQQQQQPEEEEKEEEEEEEGDRERDETMCDGSRPAGSEDVEMSGTDGCRGIAGRSAPLPSTSWSTPLASVSRCLCSLGLAAVAREAYTLAINTDLARRLTQVASGVYDVQALPLAETYVEAVPLAFLTCVLPAEEEGTAAAATTPLLGAHKQRQAGAGAAAAAAAASLLEWRRRLGYAAREALGSLRVSEMFDIAVDYPDSLPAVVDARQCLAATSLHDRFAHVFRGQIQARLLHAGASASDIIHQYVSVIRTVAHVDASGGRRLLAQVAGPIRRYLAARADTIRCCVSMVTGEGRHRDGSPDSAAAQQPSLMEELQEAATAAAADADLRAKGNADPDELAWHQASAAAAAAAGGGPDGVQRRTSWSGGSGEAEDIVSMLISVFGSKEVFVREYRNMLAESLLYRSTYDADGEIRAVELLKLRFGEAALQQCEVMLKDVSDSRRLNANVHNLALIGALPAGGGNGTGGAAGGAGTALAGSSAPDASASFGAPDARAPSGTASAQVPASVAAAYQRPSRPTASSSSELTTAGAAAAAVAAAADAVVPPAFGLLSAVVISYLFWPERKPHAPPSSSSRALLLPPSIASALQLYKARYEELKAPRKLSWAEDLGVVELEVVVGDVSLEAAVSPVHATILLQFPEQEQWGASELADAVGLPLPQLRRAMLFWINCGVLLEQRRPAAGAGDGAAAAAAAAWLASPASPSAAAAAASEDYEVIYSRATSLDPSLSGSRLCDLGSEDDNAATVVTSGQDSLLAEMAVYENYIVGMLTNYSALPLDRIHSMLRLFVIDPKYDRTPEQLTLLLSSMVARGRIVTEGGVYKKKPAA